MGLPDDVACSVTVAAKHIIQELNWKEPQKINYQDYNSSNTQQLNSSVEAIAMRRLTASLDMSFCGI